MGSVAGIHRELLLGDDPYAGFPADRHPTDRQGWGHAHPVFRVAVEALRPRLVVEVGSWKGMSAIALAQACKGAGVDAAIVCVDTWLGSPEHVIDPRSNPWGASLRRRFGYPRLYHTFLANVIDARVADLIVPFPSVSENAAAVFRRLGLAPDLIYVDAAHEEEAVARDLAAWFPLLAPGGLLIGDDYGTWEGVTRAADAFAAAHGLELLSGRRKFTLAKGPTPAAVRACLADVARRDAAEAARPADGPPMAG